MGALTTFAWQPGSPHPVLVPPSPPRRGGVPEEGSPWGGVAAQRAAPRPLFHGVLIYPIRMLSSGVARRYLSAAAPNKNNCHLLAAYMLYMCMCWAHAGAQGDSKGEAGLPLGGAGSAGARHTLRMHLCIL